MATDLCQAKVDLQALTHPITLQLRKSGYTRGRVCSPDGKTYPLGEDRGAPKSQGQFMVARASLEKAV
jgi:hypothetical protein